MKKTIIPIMFMVLLFNTTFISNVNAVIINATTCSQANVQTAINSAATGDIVVVPPGKCSWNANVIISDDKKITLKGAGIGLTVINNLLSTEVVLQMGDSGSRITGFTFNEVVIRLFAGDARIDHNKLYTATTSPGSGVYFSTGRSVLHEAPQALVDNNVFENCRVVVTASGSMMANKPWTLPLDIGGRTNVVYVEDNTFYRTYTTAANVMDANYGGAYVFRYNTIYGVNAFLNIMAHSVQGNNRATKKWEIYGNILQTDKYVNHQTFRMRGGTGLIFYNSVIGRWSEPSIDLDNVRSFSSVGDGGLCDGDSAWDGNEDGTGYPCRDQIGRGPDNPLWFNSPAGAYTQPLVPAYAWVNRTASNAEVAFRVYDTVSAKHIKSNRDYYDYNVSFNGTSGIGAGTLANRPASCTKGVAYWATNQSTSDLTGKVGNNPQMPITGTLYKCTAPNTWTAYYTPYTYPHPLRSSEPLGSSEPLSRPAPPRSLTILPSQP